MSAGTTVSFAVTEKGECYRYEKCIIIIKRQHCCIFLIYSFYYFLQLIFWLTPLISASKCNENVVNQKLCNTVLILDAFCIRFLKKSIFNNRTNENLISFFFFYFLHLLYKIKQTIRGIFFQKQLSAFQFPVIARPLFSKFVKLLQAYL